MPANLNALIILAGLLARGGLASIMDWNCKLFTPEASDLPTETYIATGIAGVTQLAEYLDTYPDTRITRLLVSDSTVQDVDGKHAHLFTDATSEEESDWDEATHHRVWAAVHDFEQPLNRILAKAAPTLEALSYLAYISYSADLHGPIYPEWTDPRLKPLVQHNYPSLTHLNFPRPGRHLDGTYRVFTEAYSPPCERSRVPNDHLNDPCYLLHEASRFPALTHLRTGGIFPSSTFAPTVAYVVDAFPRLTHVHITDVGPICELPAELHSMLEWLTPRNLTVIAEPALSARRDEGRYFKCEHDDSELTLLRGDGVHVKLPIEDEDDTVQGGVSLRRAITEFVDRARGGEGEWALPGRIPSREEWCRWRRQCSDSPGYHRDQDEL
ncbi:hypothetical protein DFH07DRAFT_1068554 [Mycena maculata]|uniref:Uncharacterized protein n=1 Tax=Mycena maculata TaxID=230809 RepID=A0AAD7H827_9AGAR|nr:hypothetical protein DFH07DRAFT_1068554 [Mycena maculata]